MIIYDDDYVITWMSELFKERNINRIGSKVLTWIPEADDLISGKEDTAFVQLDNHVYEMHRKEDEPMIFFKDVTELTEYKEKYHGAALNRSHDTESRSFERLVRFSSMHVLRHRRHRRD